MNIELVIAAIETGKEPAISALLDDESTVFWVDWREEDDAIVEYCESILQTGELAAKIVDSDSDAGFDLYITFRGNRSRVPLVIGSEDRHITIVVLNEILKPAFEIRLCVDSNGSDTLAFIPLPCETWEQLERQFSDKITNRFYCLQESPNVFTDPLPF